MTVTTAVYQPVLVPRVVTQDTYRVQLEIIGAEAFELWYVDVDGNRTLAPPDHYTVTFSGDAVPIYDSLEFTVNPVKVKQGTVNYSVERNTPITQLLDFDQTYEFPMRDIEYTFDKHMMICQELAYRKCQADVGDLEMTQLISFDPYTPLYANELTFTLDKLIAILAAIDATAQDCRDDLENT